MFKRLATSLAGSGQRAHLPPKASAAMVKRQLLAEHSLVAQFRAAAEAEKAPQPEPAPAAQQAGRLPDAPASLAPAPAPAASDPAMPAPALARPRIAAQDFATEDGRHSAEVISAILARLKPGGHQSGGPQSGGKVIVVANEKGGVGKSTLAFHMAVALCDAGHSLAAIDIDPRQRSFARSLANRAQTAERLSASLPMPGCVAARNPQGRLELIAPADAQWRADYVVIDIAGADSPLARKAMLLADILVTPVNTSFVDLDLLGQFDPLTHRVTGTGYFADLVRSLRAQQAEAGRAPMDWLVLPNRLRARGSNNQTHFDAALADLAPLADFRVGTGLGDRVAYRELFLLGLTYLDMRHIPQLSHMRSPARAELRALLADLGVADARLDAQPHAGRRAPRLRVVESAAEAGKTAAA